MRDRSILPAHFRPENSVGTKCTNKKKTGELLFHCSGFFFWAYCCSLTHTQLTGSPIVRCHGDGVLLLGQTVDQTVARHVAKDPVRVNGVFLQSIRQSMHQHGFVFEADSPAHAGAQIVALPVGSAAAAQLQSGPAFLGGENRFVVAAAVFVVIVFFVPGFPELLDDDELESLEL